MWLSRNTTTVTTAATGMVASTFLATYSATPARELMRSRDTEGGLGPRRGRAGARAGCPSAYLVMPQKTGTGASSTPFNSFRIAAGSKYSE